MTHIHHIVPKHMGGSNDPSNLRELTILEHAREHEKLFMEYGDFKDLVACTLLYGQAKKIELLSPELLEEHRKQRSESATKQWNDPEARRQLSESAIKRLSDPEARRQRSIAATKQWSVLATKKKISGNKSPRAKGFEIISPTGERFMIKGPRQFFIEHKLNPSAMTRVAKGKLKHHHGWTCRYLNPAEME